MRTSNRKYNISLTEEDEHMIEEMHSLIGYTQNSIREIFDQMAMYYLLKIAEHPDKLTELNVPFLGKVAVRYKGDIEKEDGSLGTEVDAFVSLSEECKKMIGAAHDEASCMVTEIYRNKIINSILNSSNKD